MMEESTAKKLQLEFLSIYYQLRSEKGKNLVLPELCWLYELRLQVEAATIFQ
jgi:hypothetical protein